MRLSIFIGLFFACAALFTPQDSVRADSSKIVMALAHDHIDITTNFTGDEVVLFGIQDVVGDLVVTLKGPDAYTIMRKKGQILGVWANVEAYGFQSVPRYYDYAMNVKESEIAAKTVLKQYAIGIDAMEYQLRGRGQAEKTRPFHEAMIRLKQDKSYFSYDAKPIGLVGGKLFRVAFDLPPDVPTGEYILKARIFDQGEVVAENKLALQVRQVGFSARIYRFAYANSLFYGVLVVFFAVFCGFSAHFLFARR